MSNGKKSLAAVFAEEGKKKKKKKREKEKKKKKKRKEEKGVAEHRETEVAVFAGDTGTGEVSPEKKKKKLREIKKKEIFSKNPQTFVLLYSSPSNGCPVKFFNRRAMINTF